ncbi:response regulator [Tepidibacillus decaturensis]|uniref:Response regulatory domain-containing protein n=1 Tax=Tepidibacillus decaturensis TaxID=1413211 RepID=A0A135L4J4_9BACI|nr:response regulator [Tepidibacillus decaturensis]KXG43849.1 hypothetical protein U473_07385 [Tepidibacillus decaturensis]
MQQNTVLIVDDDVKVLNSLKRALLDENFRCIFVERAKDVFDILEKEEISVIVSDMKMPEINGLELLKKVKASYPQIVRIVLSGYTQLPQVLAAINQGEIFKFITKPWNLDDEFIPVIQEAIENYNMMKEKELLRKDLERKNDSYRRIIETTKNKYDLFQENMLKVGEMATYIFRNIKEIALKDTGEKNKMVRALDIYKDLYLGYVKTLPSTYEVFDINQLTHDLDQFIFSESRTKHLQTTIKGNANLSLRGNYKLLIFILFSFYKYVIEYQNTDELPVTLTIEESPQTIKLDCFSSITLKEPIDLDHLHLIRLFLQELANNIHRDFIIYEMNGMLYTKIQLEFTKS